MIQDAQLQNQRRFPAWILLCAIGAVCALATGISSVPAFRVGVLLGVTVTSIGAMALGVRRHKPERAGMWFILASGCAMLAAATTVGSQKWKASPESGTETFLVLQVVGFVLLAAGFVGASRIRSAIKDLDSVLDAMILGLAFGLFAWRTMFSGAIDETQLGTTKVLVVSVLPAIDILVATLLLRRAFAAERTSPSFKLLFVAAASATGARIVSGMSVLSSDVLNNHVPFQIGYMTLIAAACVHPSMASVTQRDAPMLHKFGATRIALLALALLDPPLVMLMDLGQPDQSSTALLIGAIGMSLIVIVRLITLAREMEKTRERERIREARFESLVRNSTDLIAVLDDELLVTYVSPAVYDLLGFDASVILGQNAMLAFHPDDLAHATDVLTRLAPGQTSDLNLIRVLHRTGSWRWVEARAVNLTADPTIEGTVINCRDVTERVAAEALLLATNNQQNAVARLGRDALVAPDIHTLLTNAATLIQTTLNVPSCSVALFDAGEVAESVAVGAGELTEPETITIDVCRAAVRPVQYRVACDQPVSTLGLSFETVELDTTNNASPIDLIEDHEPICTVLIVRVVDRERVIGSLVTRATPGRPFTRSEADFVETMAGTLGLSIARRRAEADANHQALHDTLTTLPNRSLFVDRLSQAIARLDRSDHHIAVLFLDIDHFKVINDSLGHSAGDLILSEVAQRLNTIVRPSDTVARFGGDEFTVLLDPLNGKAEAAHIAERIRAEVARPIHVGQSDLQPTVSIGVAITKHPDAEPESLLRDADVAMYQAKEGGRNTVALFDDTMRDKVIHRLRTEIDLPHAMASGQLTMFYQPIFNVQTGKVEGLEALVRWQHPTMGLLTPDQFIPVAEQSGLIGDLDLWVMHQVMEHCASWHQNRHQGIPWHSFNVSARTVAGQDLPFLVAQALADTQVRPEHICLEITESALMIGIEHAIDVLHSVRASGVQLAVDDFGTGYSSLTYLKHLPVTELKIDASFIKGLATEGPDQAILKTIIELAATLGRRSVAEGVETIEQLDILKSLGCPLAQGYLLGCPTPAEDLDVALIEQKAAQYFSTTSDSCV